MSLGENYNSLLDNLYNTIYQKTEEFLEEKIDSKTILINYKDFFFQLHSLIKDKFSLRKLKVRKEKLRKNRFYVITEDIYLKSIFSFNQSLLKLISINQRKIIDVQYYDPKIIPLEDLNQNFKEQRNEILEIKEILQSFIDWFLENKNYFELINPEKTESFIRKMLSSSNILSKISAQYNLQLERFKFQEMIEETKRKREEILKKLVSEKEKIPLQELAPLLEFDDILELERWILFLPSKLFKIDDEMLVINKNYETRDISSTISILLEKFQEYEELGIGKKI